MTAHWLALGLNRFATGIERMVVRHAADLLSARDFVEDDVVLTLHVDAGAEWIAELPPDPRLQLVSHRDRSGRLALPPPKDCLEGATLVHSFGGALPRQGGAPRCYTVYDWGPFWDRRMNPRARLLWCYAMTRSIVSTDHVYFYSDTVANSPPRALAAVLRSKSVHVIAPPSYRPAAEPRLSCVPNDPFLLFVGSAVPRKRLDRLVEAVESSDLSLVLAGDGTERFEGQRVSGLGRVDDPTLEALYRKALAVVLISDYEGFGLPVLEAEAHGRRVIVSPEVAAVHRAERPDTLIEVDCSSVASLTDALRTWIPREIRRERKGTAHRQSHLPLELTYVGL